MSLVVKVLINDQVLAVCTARRMSDNPLEPVRGYHWERHDVEDDTDGLRRARLVAKGELWHDTTDGALGLAHALLQVIHRAR